MPLPAFYSVVRLLGRALIDCAPDKSPVFNVKLKTKDGKRKHGRFQMLYVGLRDMGQSHCASVIVEFGSKDQRVALAWILECQHSAAIAFPFTAISYSHGDPTQRVGYALAEFLQARKEWKCTKVRAIPEAAESMDITVTYVDAQPHEQRKRTILEAVPLGTPLLAAALEIDADPPAPLKMLKIDASDDEVVRFFRETDKHGFLSNFYKHRKPLVHNGKEYATAEHLFQALKFMQDPSNVANMDLADAIRTQTTPYKAKILAGGGKGSFAWQKALAAVYEQHIKCGAKFPENWNDVRIEVMEDVVRLKFEQDKECSGRLVATGEAQLIEASPFDSFWGEGRSRNGQNKLGGILGRVRSVLLE